MQEEKYLVFSALVRNPRGAYMPRAALNRAFPLVITASTERDGTLSSVAISAADIDFK